VIEWGRKEIFLKVEGRKSRTAVLPLGTGRAHVAANFGGLGGSQRHSRATTDTGCACLCQVLVFGGFGLARHTTIGTGRASLSGHGGQNFLLFSHRIRTKTYKTNKNNTKQTKIKRLNPWVASNEALV